LAAERPFFSGVSLENRKVAAVAAAASVVAAASVAAALFVGKKMILI